MREGLHKDEDKDYILKSSRAITWVTVNGDRFGLNSHANVLSPKEWCVSFHLIVPLELL